MRPRSAEDFPVETRDKLLEMIDRLSEPELLSVCQFVESVLEQDPFVRALEEAPWDDEPWTEANEKAFQESEADVAAGRVHTHAEARKLYGLS